HIPDPAGILPGQWKPAEGAVDIRFACVSHSLDDLAPICSKIRKFFKEVPSYKPGALLFEQTSERLIYVLPVALAIHDLEHDIVSHRHVNARVIKVARIHYHRLAATLGFKRS